MTKTIIVGNRLPVKIHDEGGQLSLRSSEGGLATGLSSVHSGGDNLWIGWPGMAIHEDQQEKIVSELKGLNLIPIFLTEEEINNFYEGFCNETLWPVFHYMSTYAKFDPVHWQSYQDVNKKFCDKVLEHAEPGDVIWIHDYQLLLLPGMIRNERPDASIGFFQHIPFPSYEIFRLIPWRKELLNGITGADLIGFHTYDDVRHFLSTATHLLPIRTSANIITSEERTIVVESFPMGIDVTKFEQSIQSENVQKHIQTLKETFPGVQLVLSIDRLDYSKGIIPRLQAFDNFLTEHSEYLGKVSLYMIIVPSRDTVPQYQQLRNEIDQLVGNINGRYRTVGWEPVYYFYRSADFETLVSLYATADVCLVTPMRDGMNLVCKEYIACRINNNGVLILSEMAGASKELIESIIVNPNDIKEISSALVEALTMPAEEQERRMKQLRQVISKFNITQWVKIFMERLNEVKELQNSMKAKLVGPITEANIKKQFTNAQKRVLFLDYDGTLVGFKVRVEQAYPDTELYDILNSLIADPANKIVIVSGRNHETLEEWFGQLPIDFIAEHGAWMKLHTKEWETSPNLTDEWKKEIYPVLNLYTDRTPGTFVEEKSFSLVWHYRKADEGLGELRANELTSNLRYIAADKGLQILPGNKVIEVKNIEVNKGRAVNSWLNQNEADLILAIGDDHTDEDIFKALPETAITIKVGSNISSARYYLNKYIEVRKLLKTLAG
ncbi:MAG: trehalose-phosphatase [Chitinophagaceae bacterium]|nr:trehalose-phosphatase [Chitinophagaceae bacterium]